MPYGALFLQLKKLKTFGASGSISGMFDDPIAAIAYFCVAAYVFKLWYGDFRAAQKPKNAFPGAEGAPLAAVLVAVAGALFVLFAYTLAESAAGVSPEQSAFSPWALLSIIPAAFVEELVFRGYLVVSNRGRAALVASVLGFSALFAAAHPFFWDWSEDGGFSFAFTLKASLDTFFIFLNSLWFYTVRFFPLNPRRSLVPCFAAHLAYNLGVYAVKMAQGFA